jgi:mRNA interferase MazF
MTSNLAWADAPGNVLISATESGLPKDSVANPSQIVSLDRSTLMKQAGKLSAKKLQLVMAGIDVVLGR